MSEAKKVEIIQVPNTLRAKVGGRLGPLDETAVARAEAALEDLSTQFNDWLLDEINKLEARHQRLKDEGITRENIEELYYSVHDLKGLGTTYGYPLVTRITGSLCKILDDEDKRILAPTRLIDAHIHAVKAVVRDNIKEHNHPVGMALATELEARTLDHLASVNA